MSSGLNLTLYVMIGIAILGIYLQYKSWKASRKTKRIVKGGKEKPSFIQRLCDRGETPTPTPTPVPAPIVVRPPPCPCTTRNPGPTQEVLSGLLPVIRQQAMKLQSQIMRENTRVLTEVQDVTSDASIHTTTRTPITNTPKKNPQADVTRLGRSLNHVPAYSGPTYSAQTPLSRSLPVTTSTASQTKPKKTLATTFCGYPSEDELSLIHI